MVLVGSWSIAGLVSNAPSLPGFPLVVELHCLCVPSFSQLGLWAPSSWSLLSRGCQPVLEAQHAHACTQVCSPFACYNSGCNYCSTHAATATALAVIIRVTTAFSALWLARWVGWSLCCM
jgi:hypothetical protein